MGKWEYQAFMHSVTQELARKRARMKISSCPTAELIRQKSSKEKYCIFPCDFSLLDMKQFGTNTIATHFHGLLQEDSNLEQVTVTLWPKATQIDFYKNKLQNNKW